MAIIVGGGGSQPVGPLSQAIDGYSWSQIKDIANRRTSNVGAKLLNLDAELHDVLQDFCSRHNWHWRRRSFTFNTVIGQPNGVYDLSNAGGFDFLDIKKINTVRWFKSEVDWVTLDPLRTADEIEQGLYATSMGMPDSFLIVPGTTRVMKIVPLADQIYPIQVNYWAVPNPDLSAIPERVPLVPGQLHRILIKGLEAAILDTIPTGTARAAKKQSDYEKMIQEEWINIEYVDGKTQIFNSGEEAVLAFG